MEDVEHPDRRRERGRLAAAASRREILEAGQRLFLAHGYGGTTIPAIAAEAGVAVQTIYNTVGSKRGVLGGVVELAVRGPDYPSTLSETLGERIRAEADAGRIVGLFADWLVGAHGRTTAITVVIREAAAIDAEVGELEATLAGKRFEAYRELADELARRGALAGDPESAAAAVWSVGHPEAYRFLVHERRWSEARYRRWLGDALRRILLA